MGFRIWGLGIFFPGILDFLKSWDFYPGDLGFFKFLGFLSPEIGDFVKSGFFIPGIGDFYLWGFLGMGIFRGWDFFRGMGYPTKKPPLTSDVEFYELFF